MRLPRDVSSDDLAKALKGFGYKITRQTTAQHSLYSIS